MFKDCFVGVYARVRRNVVRPWIVHDRLEDQAAHFFQGALLAVLMGMVEGIPGGT